MLYDELVPNGKYLAHYGVPKDQWSPEARAKHRRNHPQKAGDDPVGRTHERVADDYNRGGNRFFGSKVDEHRKQAAALSSKGKPNKDTPTAKGTYTKGTPNNKGTVNNKYSYGQKPSSSKNAHTRSSYKPETTNEYSLSPRAKHSPEFDDAIRQMNAVDYALNRSGRNLREYSHNGQLVKQNPSLNRVAEFEGLEPNSLRVATKAGKRKSKSRRN